MAASLATSIGILAAIVGFEMEAATARTGTGTEPTKVNRSLKGDRLPLVPDRGLYKSPAGTLEPKLPEGCVASFDAARNAFWVEVPGRCVAAVPGRMPFVV